MMAAASSSQHRCVFVGNIPYDATEEQLIQICEEVGPVVSFRLVLDRETGKPKGYGFCEYKDEETALSARRNLQGYEINGRQLRVDFAENDKGSDRNREQGRGGPGLPSNIDAQKPLGGSAVIGDPALHQPIGLPLAATAANVMAGALGGPQISSVLPNLNGFQGQSGLGNDPLTHYLSKMSRTQLFEVISEMKVLGTKNKTLARQLMVSSPQLPKAVFQAQIMLGMVPPQVLQMPNIRQSSSSIPLPSVQNGPQDLKPVLPSQHGQTPLAQSNMPMGLLSRIPGQVLMVPQNNLIPQPSSTLLPQHASMQPGFQQPQQGHPQVLLQTTFPGPSGVSSVRPQPSTGLSVQQQAPTLTTSTAMKQQLQPSLLQPPRPVGVPPTGHSQFPLPHHLSVFPRPLSSQGIFQAVSSNPPAGVGGGETISRESAQGNAISNLPLASSAKTSMASDLFELVNHPSKLARLEDGSGAPRVMMSGKPSTAGSMSVQVTGISSTSANRLPMSDGTHQPEEKMLELPPDVESALLQQVMSLTSEQLSSLPPEQRQQVLQLQQMLR